MWKHRNRMTEDEDDFFTDDLVFDEEESSRKSFWQKLFRSRNPEEEDDDDDDNRDDAIDDSDDTPPRKKPISKLLVGSVAAAAAAAILCFIGLPSTDADTLQAALVNSGIALSSCLEDSSSLFTSANQIKELVNDGNFTMNMTLDHTNGVFSLNMDYARSEKLMSGVLNWKNSNNSDGVDVLFSADKKALRLSAPALVDDVYGIRFDDLKKDKGHLSNLLELIPVNLSLPEEKIDPFSPVKLDKLLKDRAGESWTAFKISLEVEEFASRDIQVGDYSRYCTIYRITWDPAAADALARDLSGALTAIPVGILTLLPNLEPDCRLFVDEHNRVIGGDCSILGKKYTVLMTGEGYFWEQISVEILAAAEPAKYLTGGIDVTETGISLRISDDTSDFLCADYDNATGAFRISTPDTTLLEGSLVMTDSTVKMELGTPEDPSFMLELSPLAHRPVTDTSNYVDIPGMSLNELNRIVMEIQNNLRE